MMREALKETPELRSLLLRLVEDQVAVLKGSGRGYGGRPCGCLLACKRT